MSLVRKRRTGLMPGLKAFFYTWSGERPPDDTAGLEPIAYTVHGRVDFTWWDSPARGVPPEYFMVDYKGFLKVEEAGLYRFYVVTDDGSRLYVDGRLVLDAWRDQPPTLYVSEELQLRRGFHKLRLLFYCRYRFSQIKLGWMRGDRAEVIPGDALYHTISDKIFIELGEPGVTAEFDILNGPTVKCDYTPCVINTPSVDDYLDARVKVYKDGDLIYDTGQYITFFGGDEVEVAASSRDEESGEQG